MGPGKVCSNIGITVLEKEKKMLKLKRLTLIGVLVLFCVVAISSLSYAEAAKGKMMDKIGSETRRTKADLDLRSAMRKLWEEHIVYTRNYIISALADLEDVNAIAGRLLKNQDDTGDAIKPYYGEEAGKKLAALLRDHIMIAAEVVKAAKTDNKELVTVQTKWSANTDDIAAFLGSINPNWAGNDMRAMLHKHLEYVTGEVVSRLKKDWAADIDAYDQGHRHMLTFADMLTDGIVKQFPDKFKK